MPGPRNAPQHGQPATHFSFAEIAEFGDEDLVDLKDHIEQLASRQDLPVKPDWIDACGWRVANGALR